MGLQGVLREAGEVAMWEIGQFSHKLGQLGEVLAAQTPEKALPGMGY